MMTLGILSLIIPKVRDLMIGQESNMNHLHILRPIYTGSVEQRYTTVSILRIMNGLRNMFLTVRRMNAQSSR